MHQRPSHPAPTPCSQIQSLHVFFSSTLSHLQGKSDESAWEFSVRTRNPCDHLSCLLQLQVGKGSSAGYNKEWSFISRTRSQALTNTELQPAFLWQRLHSLAYPGAWNSWCEGSNKILSLMRERKGDLWTRYPLRVPSNPTQGFSTVRSKCWHIQEQTLCCICWQSLSNPVPFSVTAHVVLTAVLWFSCPSCIPALEVIISFKHWRIKTKPWLEVYWFFLRGILTGEVDPKGNSFSSIMSCFVLGKGTQNKMFPNKMFSFLSSSDDFYLQIPQKIVWSEENPCLSSVMDSVLVKIC